MPSERFKRKEKTAAALAEPEFMDELCTFVADEGKTLREFCQARGLLYMPVWQWLNDPAVSDRKKTYDLALECRAEVYKDQIIASLRDSAGVDVTSLYNDHGDLLPVSRWPAEVRTAITGIDVQINDRGEKTKKVRIVDGLRAKELLGKTMGMYKDNKVIEGKLTLEQLLADD